MSLSFLVVFLCSNYLIDSLCFNPKIHSKFSLVENNSDFSADPPRPRWPDKFYSTWFWYQAFVDGIGQNGPCPWAYNGERMYLNITAYGNGVEQLVVGDKFYQWNTLFPHSCSVLQVDYDLLEHWFDNASFIGYGTNDNYTINGSTRVEAMWMGQLRLSDDGSLQSNYLVYTNATNGNFGSKYVAINIYQDNEGRVGSEVNDLQQIQYSLPNGTESLFDIPLFCLAERET